MADNVAITAGSGTTIHADEYTHSTLGSGKTQLVKLVDGALDSSTAIAAGGGVEAGALRVTIASDSTGVVSVDDNGGALTVDGTVTANLSATDNQVLDDILADTAAIETATEATQAALETAGGLVVNLGANNDVSLNAGTNAIGKLAANSGVDIGDVDVTSIVLPRNLIGPGQPGTAIDSYSHAAINLAAAANQVLVSSAASKQIWVYGIHFVLSAAGTVSFQDEDDTAISGIMPFAANSGMSVPPSGNFSMPIWKLGTDKDLEVDLVTADMDGWIDYAIVSV